MTKKAKAASKTGSSRANATKNKTGASPKQTDAAKKSALLAAALKTVVFDGWCDDLPLRAARAANIPAAEATRLFPEGTAGLYAFFSAEADRAAVKNAASAMASATRIRDKVTLGVRARLDYLEPHKEAVRRALLEKPQGLHLLQRQLPRLVWNSADAIWMAAGDTATDYNRYTKRFLLSGVISAVTLYWLNDTSDGHEKTLDFLDDRIENVMTFGKVIAKIKKPLSGRV